MENFYCLSNDGNLYALGSHGDWEAAEDTAQNMGFDPVWVFGKESFDCWRESLNYFAENNE